MLWLVHLALLLKMNKRYIHRSNYFKGPEFDPGHDGVQAVGAVSGSHLPLLYLFLGLPLSLFHLQTIVILSDIMIQKTCYINNFIKCLWKQLYQFQAINIIHFVFKSNQDSSDKEGQRTFIIKNLVYLDFPRAYFGPPHSSRASCSSAFSVEFSSFPL